MSTLIQPQSDGELAAIRRAQANAFKQDWLKHPLTVKLVEQLKREQSVAVTHAMQGSINESIPPERVRFHLVRANAAENLINLINEIQ